MTKILLAFDDSDASLTAAETTRRLFGDDADYLAVVVSADPEATSSLAWGSVYGYPFAAPPIALEGAARSATDVVDTARDEAAKHAADAGVDAEAIGAVGDPAHAIARAARDHQADVIAVGHHQRGWLRSLFDPSVTDDLLDASEVPVLVVPTS